MPTDTGETRTLGPRRLLIAAAIVLVVYGTALGIGTLLYTTGNIATGATANTCAGFKEEIARELGINEKDVPQSEIRQRTVDCLATHTLTAREAYRSEYLFWSVWPALISAAVFLAWPVWVRVLRNQDMADAARDAARLESGT
ncbi:MAG: hypothetical protein HYX50_03300 [Chloroflexi bacterium]|nr:hypothetical protein [Chloroflexota bacterium]